MPRRLVTEPQRLPRTAYRSAPRWRLIYVIAYGALVPMALLTLAIVGAGPRFASLAGLGGVQRGRAVRLLHRWHPLGHRAALHGHALGRAHVPFRLGAGAPYLAWGTLLLPVDIALWLLVAVFVLAYVVDGRTWPGAGLGPWLSLRRQITAMVVACCVLAALALKVA
ncbi:hypothetical protein H0I39_05640 [Ottowia beijingensis]|uniref:DUF3429 domain-containing protein n=1 Tax=Ottowia beijingensis TaxID=1207057 RepID=A0A853IX77_9BURK|nr:hypothetical protein [Ottowia beijingensis]NZA01378.1 hypothetical protein [Ottowia beijingensis]